MWLWTSILPRLGVCAIRKSHDVSAAAPVSPSIFTTCRRVRQELESKRVILYVPLLSIGLTDILGPIESISGIAAGSWEELQHPPSPAYENRKGRIDPAMDWMPLD